MKSGFGADPSMPSHYQQALLQGYILSILLECGGSRDQTSFFWGNFFISECNGATSHDVPYNVVQCPVQAFSFPPKCYGKLRTVL